MGVAAETEEEKRMLAYSGTGSDSEAAEALGINFHTFRAWRQSRQLPAKGHHGGKLKPTKMTLDQLRAKLAR